MPYKWYFTLVITGAEEQELPRDYVSKLREVPSTSDPKPNRKTRLEALEKHKENVFGFKRDLKQHKSPPTQGLRAVGPTVSR